MAKKKTKSAKKAKFSDGPSVVFADVQEVLDDITNNSIDPISMSPHGRFWNTDRNTFVNRYVNMVMPLKSTFYVYLDTEVMPPSGPFASQQQRALIKKWLTTGFGE
jgi:hypothetical protein